MPCAVFEPLEETTFVAGMATDPAFRFDDEQDRVIVAIEADLEDALYVSGRFSLVPELRPRTGFDLKLTRMVVEAVDVPVIASGGVGTLNDLVDGVKIGGADAVLAASIFHYGEFTIRQAKMAMAAAGLEMRMN